MEIKKEILKICMKKGFLLDKEMLDCLCNLNEENAKKLIEGIESLQTGERVITKTFVFNNIDKIYGMFGEKTIIKKFFINLGYSRTEIHSSEKQNKQEENLEKENVKLLLNIFVLNMNCCEKF